MCHQYGLYFDEVTNFNIKHNSKDDFQGDKISIFYDPGEFPALLPLKEGKILLNDLSLSYADRTFATISVSMIFCNGIIGSIK